MYKHGGNIYDEIYYLNSGKSSFSVLIDYFKSIGIIKDKNASVFMPKWIGSPVYQEIAGKAIPSSSSQAQHDIYVMYHQYGFPQNVNAYLGEIKGKNPIIIEDCAHRIEGPVIDNTKHNIETYAIYSLTKFTFAFMLGGIYTTDKNFHQWISGWENGKKNSILMNLFKLIDEYHIRTRKFEKRDLYTKIRKMYFSIFNEYPRPLDISISLFKNNINDEVNRRTSIYKYITSQLSEFNILPENWDKVKSPYAIPLRINDEKTSKLLLSLNEMNIRANQYNFDYALNNLNPLFEKSLVIPCNSDLSDIQVELLCEKIVAQIKN